MRLSKPQLAVITVLNVIIVALVAVIFVLPYFVPKPPRGDEPDANGGTPSEPVHEKLRGAVPGKAEGIVRETQLMGSGDESVVGAYRFGEMLYLFGNATVGDYDFDGYGGFMCRVDGDGRIAAYEYFSGKITTTAVTDVGFVVAVTQGAGTDAERSVVYSLGFDGDLAERCTPLGTVCDVMPTESGAVAIVTQRSGTTIELAEYVPQDDGWKKARSTAISNGFALEYFDCYMLGEEYTLAARASSLPRYDAAVFFTFRVGGDPVEHVYGGSDENLLEPYAVLPYPQGYAVMAKRGGGAVAIGVDYSFSHYRRDNLPVTPTGGTLIGDGDRSYATFFGETSVTYAFGAELDKMTVRSDLDGKAPLYTAAGLLFVATATGMEVHRVGGGLLAAYELTAPQVYRCFADADGGYTVVLSATGGAAVSQPKGGREVYVLELGLA